MTSEWLRFDVSIGTPEDVPNRSRSALKLLFDRVGLAEQLKAVGEAQQPVPDQVTLLTTEFMRVLGLLPVVLGRQEYVVAASGTGLLRQMLIQLMLEDVAVEDRGGVLQLRSLLPSERLQELTDLPPIAATRAAVLAGHLACAQVFLPLSRALHDRCGLPWPVELEEALRRHLRTELDLELV